jgi:3-hydroxyacyl-[acyl-carrier-protein] dehydratase
MRWRLIDSILECEPGVSAVGEKTFPSDEPLFEDHFPGYPIVPGVLQVEMIAQMAGKCAALAMPGVLPVLGTVRSAKFYRNVRPGERCVIRAKIEKAAKAYVVATGEIEVEGRKVAAAEILFGLVDRKLVSSESFDDVTQEFLRRRGEKLAEEMP